MAEPLEIPIVVTGTQAALTTLENMLSGAEELGTRAAAGAGTSAVGKTGVSQTINDAQTAFGQAEEVARKALTEAMFRLSVITGESADSEMVLKTVLESGASNQAALSVIQGEIRNVYVQEMEAIREKIAAERPSETSVSLDLAMAELRAAYMGDAEAMTRLALLHNSDAEDEVKLRVAREMLATASEENAAALRSEIGLKNGSGGGARTRYGQARGIGQSLFSGNMEDTLAMATGFFEAQVAFQIFGVIQQQIMGALTEAINFQAAMVTVKDVLEATGNANQLEHVRTGLLAISSAANVAASALAPVFLQAQGSFGVQGGLDATRQSAVLSKVGGLTPQEAIRTLIVAGNDFGVTANNLSSVNDSLVSSFEKYGTPIKDLTSGLLQLADSGAAAGFSFNYLTELLAKSSQLSGIPVTQQANLIARSLTAIPDNEAKIIAFAQQNGLNITPDSFSDPASITKALYGQNLGNEKLLEFSKLLGGGGRVAPAELSFLQSAETVNPNSTAAAGSAAKLFNDQMGTMKESLGNLRTSLTDLAVFALEPVINLLAALVGSLDKVIQYIIQAVDKLNNIHVPGTKGNLGDFLTDVVDSMMTVDPRRDPKTAGARKKAADAKAKADEVNKANAAQEDSFAQVQGDYELGNASPNTYQSAIRSDINLQQSILNSAATSTTVRQQTVAKLKSDQDALNKSIQEQTQKQIDQNSLLTEEGPEKNSDLAKAKDAVEAALLKIQAADNEQGPQAAKDMLAAQLQYQTALNNLALLEAKNAADVIQSVDDVAIAQANTPTEKAAAELKKAQDALTNLIPTGNDKEDVANYNKALADVDAKTKAQAQTAYQQETERIKAQDAYFKSLALNPLDQYAADLKAAYDQYQRDMNDPALADQHAKIQAAYDTAVQTINANQNKTNRDDAIKLHDSQFAVARANANGDPVKLAEIQRQAAEQAMRDAQAETGLVDPAIQQADINNALAAEIAAGDAMSKAEDALMQSRFGLLEAIAKASGNDVQAAQDALDAANAVLASDQAHNRDPETINKDKANTVTAAAALRDAKLKDNEDTIQFNLDLHNITKAQAAAEYQGILANATILGLTKTEIRDLQKKIYDLGHSSSDIKFDLPTDINLPTLYEARRLNQTPTGQGYQDNRVITINLAANNAFQLQQATGVIVAAVGGSASRTYGGSIGGRY